MSKTRLSVWSTLALKKSGEEVDLDKVPSEVVDVIHDGSCLSRLNAGKTHRACVMSMMQKTPGHAKIATTCALFGYNDLLSYHLQNGGRYKCTDIYLAAKNSHHACVDILAEAGSPVDDISYEILGEEALKNALTRCDYEMLLRIIRYGLYDIELNRLSFLFAYPSTSKQVLFAKRVMYDDAIKLSHDTSRIDISFAVKNKRFDNLQFLMEAGIRVVNTMRGFPLEFDSNDLKLLQEIYPVKITETDMTKVARNGNIELLKYMYGDMDIKLPHNIILEAFDNYVNEKNPDVKAGILKCIKFCHDRGIGTDEMPSHRHFYRWKGSILRERLKRLGVIG